MLKDTLEILKKRKYDKDGNAIRIKLSRKQMEECHEYLPEDIKKHRKSPLVINCSRRRTLVLCRNIDSFSTAEALYRDSRVDKILVNSFLQFLFGFDTNSTQYLFRHLAKETFNHV
jgi:hypothetical protein